MPYRAAISILVFVAFGAMGCAPGESLGDGGDSSPPPASADGGALPNEDEPWTTEGAAGGGGLMSGSGSPDLGEGSRDYDACFDGLDNDGSGSIDCEDPSCAEVPACRVGSGRLCAAGAPLDLIPELGCGVGELASGCLAESTRLFGNPRPWVGGGGVHPGGDGFDSGFYRDELLDLRSEQVAISATFGPASCAGDAMDPCIETVAFGLTARSEFDDSTRVRPIAALEYRAARDQVALVLDDITVATHAFDAGRWTLELTPDGDVFMFLGDTEVARKHYAPVAGARMVSFGRNANRGAGEGDGARLQSLRMVRAACDIPDAWVERGESALALREGRVPYDAQRPTGVSVATGPEQDGTERRWVAFSEPASDGKAQVFVAFVGSTGPGDLLLAHSLDAPALAPSQDHDEDGVLDPELFFDGAAWHLYYTAVDKDGVSSIGHAMGTDPMSFRADALPALTAERWHDISHLSQPTVALDDDGALVLVARAELTDGGHTLAAFIERSDGSFLRIYSALETFTTRGNAAGNARGFDADEVAQPSLLLLDGAFHLYYGGRRGTRWGVGMLASPDMRRFRDVANGQAILGADGGSAADALGVIGLDLEVIDGSVMAFYDAFDGRDRSIGYAARPAPRSP